MMFSTKESKVDTNFQTSSWSNTESIIAQNTVEDMCSWQSKMFWYPLPILTENTKKHLFKTWFTWLVYIYLYFLL